MYSSQMLDISLNTTQSIKPLSYNLLEGNAPTIKRTSIVDNAVISERIDIDTGYYVGNKYKDDNLLEQRKVVFPISTSRYYDYMLANQSQQASEGVGAGTTALLAVAAVVGALFTGGASIPVVAGIGAAGAAATASSYGKLIGKDADARRLPKEGKGSSENGLGDLITNINEGFDYKSINEALDRDKAYYYNEVYSKGVLWDFRFNVRWDSRYWFNYWMVLDMDKMVDIKPLNPDEVELVKNIFQSGVRLWHIREATQKLDMKDFSKENLEMDVING